MVERIQHRTQLVDPAAAARHSGLHPPVIQVLPLIISLKVVIVRGNLLGLSASITAECFSAADLGEVVDPSELEDGGHAVEEAADDEPVQGRGVLDLGEVGPAVHGYGGEGEDCRDS